jgi:hypothetical protein
LYAVSSTQALHDFSIFVFFDFAASVADEAELAHFNSFFAQGITINPQFGNHGRLPVWIIFEISERI